MWGFFNSKSLSSIIKKSLLQCHPCSFDPQSGYKMGIKKIFRIYLLSILRSFRYFPNYDTIEMRCRRTGPSKYYEYSTSHNTKWMLWYRLPFSSTCFYSLLPCSHKEILSSKLQGRWALLAAQTPKRFNMKRLFQSWRAFPEICNPNKGRSIMWSISSLRLLHRTCEDIISLSHRWNCLLCHCQCQIPEEEIGNLLLRVDAVGQGMKL